MTESLSDLESPPCGWQYPVCHSGMALGEELGERLQLSKFHLQSTGDLLHSGSPPKINSFLSLFRFKVSTCFQFIFNKTFYQEGIRLCQVSSSNPNRLIILKETNYQMPVYAFTLNQQQIFSQYFKTLKLYI